MPPRKRKASTPESDSGEDELSQDFDADYKETEKPGLVPGRLAEPILGTLGVKALYDMIKSGVLNLNVEFQRAVVWNADKQSMLIMSLLQNYPIPPVYLSVQEVNGRLEHRTLDGKQRLTSIYEFFEGNIAYTPQGSKDKFFFKDVSTGKRKPKRKLLSPDLVREIESKVLTCVQYQDLSETQERDMFQRVQLGVPLTPGERLQSLSGEWAAWIRSLIRKYVEAQHENDKSEKLGEQLHWEIGRGTGFVTIAGMVASLADLQTATLRTNPMLHKFLTTRLSDPSPHFKETVESVLKKFLKIAYTKNLQDPFRPGTPRVAPIEVTMIGVLIYVMRDSTLAEISREIGRMREHTRNEHTDIRGNNRVAATLWEYCRKLDRHDEIGGGGPAPKRTKKS